MRALTALAAITVTAIIAGAPHGAPASSPAGVNRLAPHAASHVNLLSGEPAPRHLYLTSPSGHAVYSFPLTAGIPASKPDAVITGFSYPVGVAVDAAGYLYVSDDGTGTIDVLAPGANGPARFVRQLSVYVRFLYLWQDYIVAQDKSDGVDI